MNVLTTFLCDYYLWVKAIHLIFVICWMAGLFYLPRLFVYHTLTEPGSKMSDQFLLMERRLIKIIMNPAMVMTFLFGILLVLTPGIIQWSQGWFHVKLLLVFFLAGLHGMSVKWHKEFAAEQRRHKDRFFRLANEIPIVIMALIVIMVIVRPF